MIIPFRRLSAEALKGVIEEFVTRDGTDYGIAEIELERKTASVMKQLRAGEVFIVYDETTMTTNIVHKNDIDKAEYE